jgi:antitoxin MazE
MTKNLIKHGNSLALVIDKPLLDLLRIDAETPLEVTTNGDALMISPVRKKLAQDRLRAALEKVNRRHGATLKRLAE